MALAHYYAPGKKRRTDMIDVWREYAKEEGNFLRTRKDGLDEDKWVEAQALGEAMLLGYMKEYQGDKHWDVIATEQAFQVRIPYADGSGHFQYDGTFDGVYRDTNDRKVKLMEHKTAAAIRTGHLQMDDQAGSYWAVAQTILRNQGVLGKKENIKAITYNFLRKAMPDDRPTGPDGYRHNKPKKDDLIAALEKAGVALPSPRTVAHLSAAADEAGVEVWGEVSQRQPPPLFERHSVKRMPNERRTQIERMKAEVQLADKYRSGELPIIKNPSNDTCPRCPFKEMCEVHEQGGDWESFRDAVFYVRDPYADHRKVA